MTAYRPAEHVRVVLQRSPDRPVEPCGCGSPFGALRSSGDPPALECAGCGAALDPAFVQVYDLDPKERRSPGHPPCPCYRRIVVPRVRDEVGPEWTIDNGAERWDLFCVQCGGKDGSLAKQVLLGRKPDRNDDDNAIQRPEVLERARHRCELCCRFGLPLDVGHCLSKKDANDMGVPRDVRESLWNKCALCRECNVGPLGGYGDRSMSPSTYCGLSHTRDEARKMLDYGAKGPEPVNPDFYRIYTLLRQRFADRRRAA